MYVKKKNSSMRMKSNKRRSTRALIMSPRMKFVNVPRNRRHGVLYRDDKKRNVAVLRYSEFQFFATYCGYTVVLKLRKYGKKFVE